MSCRLYESALAAVQAYAKYNTNRLSTESFAEESSCQDLSLVLDLLTFILAKDCVDLHVRSGDEEITVGNDCEYFLAMIICQYLSTINCPTFCAINHTS